jgi:hypothetical protein
MKLRQGFVSNSSSTSFCIYGTFILPKTEKETLDNIMIQSESNALEAYIYYEESSNREVVYVGKTPGDDMIPDNMTFGEFRRSIEEKIKKVFGKKMKCKTYK